MPRGVKEHAFLSEGRPRDCARHRQLFVPCTRRARATRSTRSRIFPLRLSSVSRYARVVMRRRPAVRRRT